jgi:hypothetical protein
MTINPSTWMSDNYAALKDTPFSQITLFGSHDSGMSTLKDCAGAQLGTGGITQAQTLSVHDQIVQAGARYLDIRPVSWWGDGDSGYYAAHYSTVGGLYFGWLGESLTQIISEIGQAVESIGAHEVLLIELSHGVELADVTNQYGATEARWAPLAETDLATIASMFANDATLQKYLYQAPSDSSATSFWSLTPGDFDAAGAKVFIFAGADTSTTTANGPIFLKTTAANYADPSGGPTPQPSNLYPSLAQALAENLKPSQPFLLPYHCTGEPAGSSLQSMAEQVNPQFMDYLAAWSDHGFVSHSDHRMPTIIDADWVSGSDLRLLEACVGMNFGLYYGLVQQTINGQSCNQGPALAALGGVTYAAWAGTDSHLNVMSSADGVHYSDPVTSTQGSAQSPTLCACGDALMIAWTGTDGNVNVGQIDGTKNAIVKLLTTSQSALHGPALASLGGTLYLAWTGTDNHLNLMWSTDAGHSFPSGNKYTITTESSADSPALCVLDGTLYLIWKGTDSQLNVLPLEVSGAAVTGVGTKVQPGQGSDHGPAAAVVDGTMYIAYVGSGYGELNVVWSTDGRTFASPYVSRNEANATPALAANASSLAVAWAGTDDDHSLNTAQFVLPGQSIAAARQNQIPRRSHAPERGERHFAGGRVGKVGALVHR